MHNYLHQRRFVTPQKISWVSKERIKKIVKEIENLFIQKEIGKRNFKENLMECSASRNVKKLQNKNIMNIIELLQLLFSCGATMKHVCIAETTVFC